MTMMVDEVAKLRIELGRIGADRTENPVVRARVREAAAALQRLQRDLADEREHARAFWAANSEGALKLVAAGAQVEALRKMLGEAIGDILDLAHARWSEVEATDDELVGHYRAALAGSTPDAVKQECCMAPECRVEGYCLYQQRACAGAEENAVYPGWRPTREQIAQALAASRACVPLRYDKSDAEFFAELADTILALPAPAEARSEQAEGGQ